MVPGGAQQPWSVQTAASRPLLATRQRVLAGAGGTKPGGHRRAAPFEGDVDARAFGGKAMIDDASKCVETVKLAVIAAHGMSHAIPRNFTVLAPLRKM